MLSGVNPRFYICLHVSKRSGLILLRVLFCFHLEIAGWCPGDGDGFFASWLKHSLAGLNAEAVLQRFRNVPQEVNILEGEETELRQTLNKGIFPRSLGSERCVKMHQSAQNEKRGFNFLLFLPLCAVHA